MGRRAPELAAAGLTLISPSNTLTSLTLGDDLANPKRREVGLIAQLPVAGDVMPMAGMRMPQPWVVMDQMRQVFQVRQFGSDTGTLPKDLQILMLIHPKELSEEGQYAIDQFLLGGKPVFLALDPSSQHFKRQGGQQQMMMGGRGGMMMGGREGMPPR